MGKEYRLNLRDELFDGIVDEYNSALNKIVSNAEKRGYDAAKITLEIDLELEEKQLDFDPALKMPSQKKLLPTFKHKVTSTVQIKNSVKGSIGGDYELVKSQSGEHWNIRTIDDGQMNLFD